MAKKPQALVATCSAPQIQQAVHDWLVKQKLYGHHNRVAIFGSVKNREVLMKQVRVAVDRDGIKKIFLFSHQGCQAYSDREFANQELEREALENDLRNTAAAIKAEIPKMSIKPYIISGDQKIVEVAPS